MCPELGHQPVGPPNEHAAVPCVTTFLHEAESRARIGLLGEPAGAVDSEAVHDLLGLAELNISETGRRISRSDAQRDDRTLVRHLLGGGQRCPKLRRVHDVVVGGEDDHHGVGITRQQINRRQPRSRRGVARRMAPG